MTESTPRPRARTRRSSLSARGTRREWSRLAREIDACRRCPFGTTRAQAVIYRGSLAPRIVFVGEAPGAEEDRRGVPFVGRSGRLLERAVRSLGIPEDAWGVLNLIKCRPPRNRFDPRAARACRPFLDRQLALLRPEVVVTLGAHALRTFDPGAPPVLRSAGTVREADGRPVFPLLHPAASLRSRRWSERWAHDLESFEKWWRDRRAARF